MSIKKKILLAVILCFVIGGGLLFYFFNPWYWFLENHYASFYDREHPQQPVTSYKQIDEVLKRFQQISYPVLDTNYLQYSRSTETKYRKILESKTYYIIEGEDIYLFLVGNFRVKDFLAKDKFYTNNLHRLGDREKQYLLIDKKLLYALLDLQHELIRQQYDPQGFRINFAHRHPLLNVEVGGASVSYHIRGQAIDLVIQDINKDGKATKEDKKIVLDILENKIIRNRGGIGRYPWSMVVHFDVRGYKARWDRQ